MAGWLALLHVDADVWIYPSVVLRSRGSIITRGPHLGALRSPLLELHSLVEATYSEQAIRRVIRIQQQYFLVVQIGDHRLL